MQFHPLAELFPLIEGAEFDALVTSIRENGQREAIVTLAGKILDGRNRYRACMEAKVTPVTMPYTGDDPVKFIFDMNLHRRHLNPSQRAMIAAELCNLGIGQRVDYANKPADVVQSTSAQTQPIAVSQGQAAKMLSVNRSSVVNAKKVLDEGTPEQVSAIRKGEATVTTTARDMRAGRTEADKSQARLEQAKNHQETMTVNGQLYGQFRDAIDALSGLPAPAEVAAIVRGRKQFVNRVGPKIPTALKWLTEFAAAWNQSND